MKKWIIVVLILLLLFIPPILAFYKNRDTKSIYDLKPSIGNFINIKNVDVYYELTGKKDNPVIVLVHGFGGNSSSWIKNISTLHDLGYQTLAIDLPPFGYSQKSRYYNITQDYQADLINELLNKLDIKKASFMGHSYGGGVILHIASQYTSKVEQLIIVDGAVNSSGRNLIKPISSFIKLPLVADYIKSWITILITPESAKSILQSTYFNPTLITQEQLDTYISYSKTNDWQEGYLAIISTPYTTRDIDYEKINNNIINIDLIWGEKDMVVPLEKGKELNTKLINSKLITIPNSGHLPMEESYTEFNLKLKEILKK